MGLSMNLGKLVTNQLRKQMEEHTAQLTHYFCQTPRAVLTRFDFRFCACLMQYFATHLWLLVLTNIPGVQ